MNALALVEDRPVAAVRPEIKSILDFRSDRALHVNAINALEAKLFAADADVDAIWWELAAHVVALIDAGMSQRALAKQWLNPRRQWKPYTRRHVQVVLKVYRGYSNSHPRPRFLDKYNEITNPIGSYATENCFTPSNFIEAARTVFGGTIDLDPASCLEANEIVRATRFFTKEDDGLAQPWRGRVWLNPPFTRSVIPRFVDKLVGHVQAGDVPEAIVLTNSATDTKWWAKLHHYSVNVVFPTGRVLFLKPNGRHEPAWILGTSIFYFGRDPQKFDDAFARFVWRGEAAR